MLSLRSESSSATSTRNIVGSIFLATSAFYTVRVGLSPIYFFFLSGLLLAFSTLFQRSSLVFSLRLALLVAALSILAIQQILVGAKANVLLGFVMSFLYIPICRSMLGRVASQGILKALMNFLRFNICLILVDTYYRFTYPNSTIPGAVESDLWIYKYKVNGIMFQDSNFVAQLVIVCFFCALYLRKCIPARKVELQVELILMVFVYALLLFGTLSRAAILAVVVGVAWSRSKLAQSYFFTIFSLSLMGLIIFVFRETLLNLDGSFAMKLEEFSRIQNYVARASNIDIFWGKGFGQSAKYFGGLSAHNLFFAYFVEAGIVGLGIILYLWHLLYRYDRSASSAILFPLLISGQSLGWHSAPYAYAVIASLSMLNLKSKEEGGCCGPIKEHT